MRSYVPVFSGSIICLFIGHPLGSTVVHGKSVRTVQKLLSHHVEIRYSNFLIGPKTIFGH